MQIQRPMLAATLVVINDVFHYKERGEFVPYLAPIIFPLLATPKIDGIRCLIVNNQTLSRSFKVIPNTYIREMLQSCPNGFDGELVVGDNFQDTQSAIMTQSGKPNFKYLVFDWFTTPNSYENRCNQLHYQSLLNKKPSWISFLLPKKIRNMQELVKFEKECYKQGHEGVMIRTPESPYKFGRSTLNEFFLVKLIRRVESEAKAIEFHPLMHNENEDKIDELGYKTRSSNKSGMKELNMLGSITGIDIHTGVQVSVGTGFDAKQRKEFWKEKNKLRNRILTYQYKPFGVKDAPRAPVFKCWRKDKEFG